jgi:hypothetical protein
LVLVLEIAETAESGGVEKQAEQAVGEKEEVPAKKKRMTKKELASKNKNSGLEEEVLIATKRTLRKLNQAMIKNVDVCDVEKQTEGIF